MKCKKIAAMMCLIAMVVSMLAGCGSTADADASAATVSESREESSVEAVTESQPENTMVSAESAEETIASAEETVEGDAPLALPLTTDGDTLSMFYYYPPFVTDYVDDISEISFFQTMQELTGVTIEFRAASLLVVDEQFSLMVASEDYTDMVYGFAMYYEAGIESALEDEVIYDLSEFMDAGYMPSYSNLLHSDETMLLDAMTDSGAIPVAASILGDDYLPNAGMVIRQDLLDSIGAESPDTYDEWYRVLTAFKTELGIDGPLSLHYSGATPGDYLAAGYGISASGLGVYVVDGQVKLGVLEEGYAQYLTTMNQWYQEGLIWQDFYSATDTEYTDISRIVNDEAAVWYTDMDTMSQYASASDNPDFRVVGVSDPVQNKGDVNHLRKYGDADPNLVNLNNGIAITTACSNPELAAQWLDVHYSDEGILLTNYGGLEGVTYQYDENGDPVLSELVTNNPDMVYNHALSFYCAKNYCGYYEFKRTADTLNDDVLKAIAIWNEADASYGYPSNAYMTASESAEYAATASDIETYISEHLIKFITGDESLDNLAGFQQTLIDMGIERCLEIKQDCYDRYIGRAATAEEG